jgi:hypothetical protein
LLAAAVESAMTQSVAECIPQFETWLSSFAKNYETFNGLLAVTNAAVRRDIDPDECNMWAEKLVPFMTVTFLEIER